MQKTLQDRSKADLIQLIQDLTTLTQEQDKLVKNQELVIQDQSQNIDEQNRLIKGQAQTLEADQATIAKQKAHIAYLQRMLYGQKRERFEGNKNQNQLSLPFEATQEQVKEQKENFEAKKEKVTYERRKPSKHKGRMPLPDDLPVEEVKIYPDGNLEEMICIGQDVTDELRYNPAHFFIRRYIRYKYAYKDQDQSGIKMGDLPERAIDKGRAGSDLLAHILVNKYMDHLPLYRQIQRFSREGVDIPASTMDSWVRSALDKLSILYDHLLVDIKSKGYLQVDETVIRVLDKNKKGKSHKGYYWVYNSPLDQTVLFDYQPGRGEASVASILSDFEGYLQSDGYQVYDSLIKGRDKLRGENKANEAYDPIPGKLMAVGCWAHARRKFEEAQSNDKKRSVIALTLIQDLYKVEREAKEGGLSPPEHKTLRLDKSLPIINQLGKWIALELKHTTPASQIGKAMSYCFNRWNTLSAYLHDGLLEIDNNGVENAIRPVALGRKNYLFAGSHAAAQRAGMMYSFFAICKKHGVNPYDWLKYVLENIMTIDHRKVRDLYPQNFKQIINT